MFLTLTYPTSASGIIILFKTPKIYQAEAHVTFRYHVQVPWPVTNQNLEVARL